MGSVNEENMAAIGWVRLPMDEDGEYIRIGDEMVDKSSGKRFTVGHMTFYGSGWVIRDVHGHDLPPCTHYHKPTVEDVLKYFADETGSTTSELTPIIERYAERLREAME